MKQNTMKNQICTLQDYVSKRKGMAYVPGYNKNQVPNDNPSQLNLTNKCCTGRGHKPQHNSSLDDQRCMNTTHFIRGNGNYTSQNHSTEDFSDRSFNSHGGMGRMWQNFLNRSQMNGEQAAGMRCCGRNRSGDFNAGGSGSHGGMGRMWPRINVI